MTTKIPYTNTRLAIDTDDEDELLPRVPHALETLAKVRAQVAIMRALCVQIDAMLSDDSDPLHRAMAQMLARNLCQQLDELARFAEIG